MQLQCWQGPHIAVAVMAVMIGVPSLLGYWLLLLVLAWPVVTDGPDGKGSGAGDGGTTAGTPSAAAAAATRRRRAKAGQKVGPRGLIETTSGLLVARPRRPAPCTRCSSKPSKQQQQGETAAAAAAVLPLVASAGCHFYAPQGSCSGSCCSCCWPYQGGCWSRR